MVSKREDLRPPTRHLACRRPEPQLGFRIEQEGRADLVKKVDTLAILNLPLYHSANLQRRQLHEDRNATPMLACRACVSRDAVPSLLSAAVHSTAENSGDAIRKFAGEKLFRRLQPTSPVL